MVCNKALFIKNKNKWYNINTLLNKFNMKKIYIFKELQVLNSPVI